MIIGQLGSYRRGLLNGIAGRLLSGGRLDHAFLVLLVATAGLAALPVFLGWSKFYGLTLGVMPFVLIGTRALHRHLQLGSFIRNEQECLERFCANARDRWAEIKLMTGAKISERDILDLAEPGLRARAPNAKMLIERLANPVTAFSLISAPSDSISRPFRDDLEGGLRDVLAHAGLSTKLGILGTFVGFIGALSTLGTLFTGLSPSQQGGGTGAAVDWGKMSGPLHGILDDLAFAFVTSIYGLFLAVLIQFLGSRSRSPLDHLYKLFDDALSYGRELASRMAFQDPAIVASLTKVKTALEDVQQTIYSHGQSVVGGLEKQNEAIADNTALFAKAAQGLADAQKQWDGAFKMLADAGGALDRQMTVLTGTIEKRLEAVAGTLAQAVENLGSGQEELVRARETVTTAVAGTFKQVDERWQAHLESLLEQNTELARRSQGTSQQVLASLGGLEKEFKQIGDSLKALQASLEKTTESQQSLVGTLDGALARPLRSGGRFGIWILIIVLLAIAIVAGEILLLGDPIGLRGSLHSAAQYLEALFRPLR